MQVQLCQVQSRCSYKNAIHLSSLKQKGIYHRLSLIYRIVWRVEGTDFRLRMTLRMTLKPHQRTGPPRKLPLFPLSQLCVLNWKAANTVLAPKPHCVRYNQEATSAKSGSHCQTCWLQNQAASALKPPFKSGKPPLQSLSTK